MGTANDLLPILNQHPDGVTVETLAWLSGKTHPQVLDSCAVLRRHGLVDRPQQGTYRLTMVGKAAVRLQQTVLPGPAAGTGLSRRSTFRQRLWQALRASQKASIQDLLKLAQIDTDADRQALKNAQKYLRLLECAGYIARLDRRQAGTSPSSNGHIRWLMIRDTGPKPPSAYPERGYVHDHNTHDVYPIRRDSRRRTAS